MADTITIKELAGKAGVKPQILRRVLRAKFPRETKGKAYKWQLGDPQIEQILKAVKGNDKLQPEKPKAQNKATKKPTKPVTPNGKKGTVTPSKPEPVKADNQKGQ